MAFASTTQIVRDSADSPSAQTLPCTAPGRWVALGLAPPPSSRRLWESGAIGLYHALVGLPAGGRWLPGLLEVPGLGLGRALAAFVPVEPERIEAWLDALAEEGLIALDRAAGLIYLPQLVACNVPRNRYTVAAIARQWQRVKGSPLAQRAARDLVAAAERAEPGREQRRRGQHGPEQPILDRLKQALGLALAVVAEPAQRELEIPTPAARPRLRVVDRFAGPDHRLDMDALFAHPHAEKSHAREGDAVQRLNHGASPHEVHMAQHTLPLGGVAAGDKSAAPSTGLEGDDDVQELRPKRIINGVLVDPGSGPGVGAQAWHGVQSPLSQPPQGSGLGGGASAGDPDRGRLGVLPSSSDGRRAADGDAPARTAEFSARLPARGFAAAWLAAAAVCPALRAARPALTATGLAGDAENRLARWWLDNAQYQPADLLTLADWLNAGGDHTLRYGGKSVVAALSDGKLGSALDSALAWHDRGRPRLVNGREVKHGVMVYDGGRR